MPILAPSNSSMEKERPKNGKAVSDLPHKARAGCRRMGRMYPGFYMGNCNGVEE